MSTATYGRTDQIRIKLLTPEVKTEIKEWKIRNTFSSTDKEFSNHDSYLKLKLIILYLCYCFQKFQQKTDAHLSKRIWSQFQYCLRVSSDSKESACNAGDSSLIPGLGRSPGEGNGNPLQYSCLENSMDRGAWQAIVHGVARVRHNLVTNPEKVNCGF